MYPFHRIQSLTLNILPSLKEATSKIVNILNAVTNLYSFSKCKTFLKFHHRKQSKLMQEASFDSMPFGLSAKLYPYKLHIALGFTCHFFCPWTTLSASTNHFLSSIWEKKQLMQEESVKKERSQIFNSIWTECY